MTKNNIDKTECEGLISSDYNKGDIIYPGKLKSALGLSFKDIYEILEKRKDTDNRLIIVCPKCDKEVSKPYRTIGELPEKVNCSCGCKIVNTLECAIVVYEKI